MSALSHVQGGDSFSNLSSLTPARRRTPKWDLAFIGVFAYMVIEYTRLSAMFPVLQGFDVGKIAAGVGALGLFLSPRRTKGDSFIRKIDMCVGLFLFVTVISAIFADYPSPAWNQVIDSSKWVVVYFLVSRAVISPWRSRIFVVTLLLLNLKLAQFAIRLYVQYGATNIGDQSVAMVGLTGNAFFGNSNDFGVAMCIVLPIAASLLLGEAKFILRLVYLASFLGILAAMLLSGCRGAFLATCVAAGVFVVRGKRKTLGIAMGILIAIGTLVMLPSGNLERLHSAFSPETDSTVSQRIGFWRAAFKMFAHHPLLGVGPGNFAPTFRDHYGEIQRDPGAWAPHSIYIQGFAELGFLGALPLFILFWLTFRINYGTRKLLEEAASDQKLFELRLALGLEMAVVAYLVSGAFLTVLYYPHLWFLLGMSVGLRVTVNILLSEKPANPSSNLHHHLALSTN